MFSIMNIIYGVPLTRDAIEKIDEWERNNSENWFESNGLTCGFEILYNRSTYVGFCGVNLGSFNELENYINIDPSIPCIRIQKSFNSKKSNEKVITLKPTQNQIDETTKLVENLHPLLRSLVPDIGLYIVISSS